MNRARWHLLPTAPEESFHRTDLPPLLIQILHNRNLFTPSQYEPFLAADERLSTDPFRLSGVSQAVLRIHRALLSGERIAVYGDFDADGITATLVLTQGLALLGASPIVYIPHRLDEGHGLHHGALAKLIGQGVSLAITVDCGIGDIEEVSRARENGLDIVITDHHTLPQNLPPAAATINPKQDDPTLPSAQLAGVGVAYKLLQALLTGTGKEGELPGFLDLVALGTVADMVPLVEENRYLVKQGLRIINNPRRPGLAELIRLANLTPGSLDAEAIAWSLGPRLNAAGRMDHAMLSYDLLSSESLEQGRELAQRLEEQNRERQVLTNDAWTRAREQVLASGADAPLLWVEGEDYPLGLVGIVAGRLVEEFHRPAVVVGRGEEASRGSARSIPEFDIIAAFTENAHLLSRFGGHPAAAGFTLPTPNLAPLFQSLMDRANLELSGCDLRPELLIDVELPLEELDAPTFATIQRMAPFGQGNPTPNILSSRARVADHRTMGNNGDHLRLKLQAGDIAWDAVGFNMGHLADTVTPDIDIVYYLGLDTWGGQEKIKLYVRDFRPSTP
ncbi:MAG: single-stranded-DNA-specific exonuclease RecJ [Dehalococcoidia bacterium]